VLGELWAGEVQDCSIHRCQLALVMDRYGQQIGVCYLLGSLHPAFKAGGGFKDVNRGGPEAVACFFCEGEEQFASFHQGVFFPHTFRGTGDSQKSCLGEGAGRKRCCCVGLEPGSNLGLLGVPGPQQGDEQVGVEQIRSHPSSAWARRTSAVVIHSPSIGISAVGNPSTYFTPDEVCWERSMSSEMVSLSERPVAP
jgi:hypothetical protein